MGWRMVDVRRRRGSCFWRLRKDSICKLLGNRVRVRLVGSVESHRRSHRSPWNTTVPNMIPILLIVAR